MLKNAPIVILDEATAFTDPENEALIQSSVAKLTKGKTLLVIAHRLSTITQQRPDICGGGWQYPLQWYPPGAAGKGQPVRTDVAFSYCCAGYGGRRCSTMIQIFRRFFNFCGEINKRKFTKSIFLGVLKAMFEALKIPAIAVTYRRFERKSDGTAYLAVFRYYVA